MTTAELRELYAYGLIKSRLEHPYRAEIGDPHHWSYRYDAWKEVEQQLQREIVYRAVRVRRLPTLAQSMLYQRIDRRLTALASSI